MVGALLPCRTGRVGVRREGVTGAALGEPGLTHAVLQHIYLESSQTGGGTFLANIFSSTERIRIISERIAVTFIRETGTVLTAAAGRAQIILSSLQTFTALGQTPLEPPK